jgi:hypothetical protein
MTALTSPSRPDLTKQCDGWRRCTGSKHVLLHQPAHCLVGAKGAAGKVVEAGNHWQHPRRWGRLSFGFTTSRDLSLERRTTSTDTDKARSNLLSMLVNKCFRLCARAPHYDAARGLIYIDHQGTYIVKTSWHDIFYYLTDNYATNVMPEHSVASFSFRSPSFFPRLWLLDELMCVA